MPEPLLIESPFCLPLGPTASDGELHVQDQANEPWTCSPSGRALEGQGTADSTFGNKNLTNARWARRLLLGGSEVASRGAGCLEGALNAAVRLRSNLMS